MVYDRCGFQLAGSGDELISPHVVVLFSCREQVGSGICPPRHFFKRNRDSFGTGILGDSSDELYGFYESHGNDGSNEEKDASVGRIGGGRGYLRSPALHRRAGGLARISDSAFVGSVDRCVGFYHVPHDDYYFFAFSAGDWRRDAGGNRGDRSNTGDRGNSGIGDFRDVRVEVVYGKEHDFYTFYTVTAGFCGSGSESGSAPAVLAAELCLSADRVDCGIGRIGDREDKGNKRDRGDKGETGERGRGIFTARGMARTGFLDFSGCIFFFYRRF